MLKLTDKYFYMPANVGSIEALNEFAKPLIHKSLEVLRQAKTIGQSLEAKVIIYVPEEGTQGEDKLGTDLGYNFFRSMNTVHSGIRELCKVSLVEVVKDNAVENIKVEAVSLKDNPDYSECPRCQIYHTKKDCWYDVDKNNKQMYICKKCETIMLNDYPNHAVTQLIKNL